MNSKVRGNINNIIVFSEFTPNRLKMESQFRIYLQFS